MCLLFLKHMFCALNAKGYLADGVLCACVYYKAVADVVTYNEIIQESGLMGVCSHYQYITAVAFTACGCMERHHLSMTDDATEVPSLLLYHVTCVNICVALSWLL